MLRYFRTRIWKIFTHYDAIVKFPNLRRGEIGIQAGFDMDNLATTDLLSMYKRVKPEGMVVGIEADPRNIELGKEYIETNKLNIKPVFCGLFSDEGEVELVLGEKKGWNQLNNIPIDDTVSFTGDAFKVPMNTLDNIIEENNIDIKRIGHINLTINGAEYFSLLGMKKILTESDNLNLTVVAGRYDDSGYVDGIPDYVKIIELLRQYGFSTKFKRIHELFWWGFIVKTILNRKWIYGKKNYGVVFASKGNKKHKWYQSFS
jgi:FkbM family methyltransferase